MSRRYVTIREYAAEIGVSMKTIYRWIESGRIPDVAVVRYSARVIRIDRHAKISCGHSRTLEDTTTSN